MEAQQFDIGEVFDDDYLYFYEPLLEGASDGDAELIWQLLELDAGSDVLDVPCGHGRITSRLAGRGARATGLDATPRFLEIARADAVAAGLEIEYVEGDMRSLPWPDQQFDCVLSWFTSFGYFDEDGNRRVLSEAHRVLRPGGRFLVELNNLVELLPRWQPSVVAERDGNLSIDRSRFDPVTGRVTTDRVLVRDGAIRRFTFSVRMFVAVELDGWLRAAGFRNVAFYDGAGEPLTAEGRRMIAVATR